MKVVSLVLVWSCYWRPSRQLAGWASRVNNHLSHKWTEKHGSFSIFFLFSASAFWKIRKLTRSSSLGGNCRGRPNPQRLRPPGTPWGTQIISWYFCRFHHTHTDTHTLLRQHKVLLSILLTICRYLEQCVFLRWWMEVSRSETRWWWNLKPPTASDRQHLLWPTIKINFIHCQHRSQQSGTVDCPCQNKDQSQAMKWKKNQRS